MNKTISGLLCFCLSFHVMATSLPPNNLHLADDRNQDSNVTEQQFNEVIDILVELWAAIAKTHNATLESVKNWADPTVNAYASQTENKWVVSFFGGLARRPEMTLDGFTSVVCHELGHHFGGHFFYSFLNWAAAEGQADYFATHTCLRRLWKDEVEENQKVAQTAPLFVKKECETIWESKEEQALCARIALAGLSFANLNAAVTGGNLPNFENPDPSITAQTNEFHPASQCRLDTYVSGALCGVAFDLNVIPGKGHPKGNNSAESEKLSNDYVCVPGGKVKAFRPNCWFKSQL